MNRHTTTTNLLTQTSLLKMALVAREKSTIKQIAKGTELSEAYTRKMLIAHKAHFQFTGYTSRGANGRPMRIYRVRPEVIETLNRNIDALQKLLIQGNKPVLSSDFVPQTVYKNSYDQLMREAQIVDCKKGQPHTYAEAHTDDYLTWAKHQRLQRKSSRTHVGVADYAALV